MGLIFVLLSMDESASFHEMSIHPLRDRLNLADIGFLHFTWVVPAIVMLMVLFVIYLPFVFALPARTRWGLVAAATIYVFGAVGMEMVGGAIAAQGRAGSTAFAVGVTIEEGFEMLGLVLLLHTLMTYAFVRTSVPAIRQTLAPSVSDRPSPAELSSTTERRSTSRSDAATITS